MTISGARSRRLAEMRGGQWSSGTCVKWMSGKGEGGGCICFSWKSCCGGGWRMRMIRRVYPRAQCQPMPSPDTRAKPGIPVSRVDKSQSGGSHDRLGKSTVSDLCIRFLHMKKANVLQYITHLISGKVETRARTSNHAFLRHFQCQPFYYAVMQDTSEFSSPPLIS